MPFPSPRQLIDLPDGLSSVVDSVDAGNGHGPRNGGQIPGVYVDPKRRRLVTEDKSSRLPHALDPSAMINDYIEVNPRKLGGTPVFRDTRIPVYVLFDYLEEGYTVEDFLDEYDIAPDVVHGFMRAVRGIFVTEEEAEA